MSDATKRIDTVVVGDGTARVRQITFSPCVGEKYLVTEGTAWCPSHETTVPTMSRKSASNTLGAFQVTKRVACTVSRSGQVKKNVGRNRMNANKATSPIVSACNPDCAERGAFPPFFPRVLPHHGRV